ncbi:Oidioi.mRNA.OKI2018_I69.chr1.g201.t1.cds [Oikopleura dioica]|uniref:Oidioi.mRNA.OKI2018_I69.chr1.g201.t1.cds n=1 Tax=Oikopleura dioica TaxID=34765 RepID=A0ABN7SQD5_OIKDI|nr:Oidioi.mRNA.OKI2018_I69.chr1.g201.t1.cds [Oikopleura dioica]
MKKIKKTDTYGLLWNQDQYEKNISNEWIQKVTSHKSYSYKASSLRETTKILSLELTKTFLFLSLWRKLMDRPSSEELSFSSLIFNNLALFPFILSTIYSNRSRIPSAVFYFALILVLSPIYANLTTSISTDTILNLAMFSFTLRYLAFDFSTNEPGAVSRNSALFGLFFGSVVAFCIAAKFWEWKNRDGEDSDEGDFYSTAIALKDETLRRIVEQLERARYSAVRIKHSAKNSIVLPSRANLLSRDRTESEENEATLTESSYYDCSSWDFNRSSAKLRYKDDGIHPECFLSMDDCIRRNDYPCDVFTVETEDGFLIEIHRLRNEGKPAVLMQHGILGDSSHWLAAGPDHGLAYRLWDEGFDVFLANTRGNPYSRRHTELSPDDDPKFWRWTFHEIAKYEIPAIVHKICKIAKQEKIWYIAHSQGTLLMFVNQEGGDEETKKRLHGMIALAPILSLKNVKGAWRSLVGPFKSFSSNDMVQRYLDSEFLKRTKATRYLAKLVKDSPELLKAWGTSIAQDFAFHSVNFNHKRYVQERLQVFVSHTPSGTSFRNVVHFGQNIGHTRMAKFDYGAKANLIVYNSESPPFYDWTKIDLPIHLFVGTSDWIATPDDVRLMRPNLRNSTLTIIDDFDHLDFIWGKTAREELHPKIIEILKSSSV